MNLLFLVLPLDFAVFVLDLRIGVYPYHALRLGVGNIFLRRRRCRFDNLFGAALGLIGGLGGGSLRPSGHGHRQGGREGGR